MLIAPIQAVVRHGNLAIARIVLEHLEALNMKLPKPSVDLGHIRREYHAAQAE